jgi:tetratricopeptide (TPR) repeat protein
MAMEHYKQALGIYADAYAKSSSDAALVQYYASALLKTDHYRQARDLLKTALQQRPESPVLYQMLAQAAGGMKSSFESHKALAEYYYFSGNPNAAINSYRSRPATQGQFLSAISLKARIAPIRKKWRSIKSNPTPFRFLGICGYRVMVSHKGGGPAFIDIVGLHCRCLYTVPGVKIGLVILGKIVNLLLSLMAGMKERYFHACMAYAKPVRFLRQWDEFDPRQGRTNRSDMFKLFVTPQ